MRNVCQCGNLAMEGSQRCIFHQPPPNKKARKLLCIVVHPSVRGDQPTFRAEYNQLIEKVWDIRLTVLSEQMWKSEFSWYFINHFTYIDLVFNPRSHKALTAVLRDHCSIRKNDIMEIGLLDEETYGGRVGVLHCYRALEAFSELRVATVANKLENLDAQLLHYFLNQRGFDNQDEVNFHARCAGTWARRIMGER